MKSFYDNSFEIKKALTNYVYIIYDKPLVSIYKLN